MTFRTLALTAVFAVHARDRWQAIEEGLIKRGESKFSLDP